MSSMVGKRGLGGATGNDSANKLAGYDIQKFQQFTPEQMQLFQQMFSEVSPDSYTGRLSRGDQGLFDEMEAPALKQFSGLQGNLASRFSAGGGGRGALGSRKSSGFQNTASQQGADFAQQLQSNRQNLQRQAIKDLMGMRNDLLSQRPYEYFAEEEERPWWQSAIGGALPLAGAAAGGFFGGPAGAAAGGKAGAAASRAFFD